MMYDMTTGGDTHYNEAFKESGAAEQNTPISSCQQL